MLIFASNKKIRVMKNLRVYKENGYNYKYIVVINGHSDNPDFEVFYTRKQAERADELKFNCKGDVLTFKQAAEEYPENFRY